MKIRHFLFLAAMLCTTVAMASVKPTTVYIYGFSASFNDSTVYFTDIIELDSAWVDSKTGFLYSRDDYSYQLKNYVSQQGVGAPTCLVVYATTREKAEKKFVKMREKYSGKRGKYLIKYIPADAFTFTAVSAADDPNANIKEEKKKEEKRPKGDRPRGGRPGGPGNGGPGMGGPGMGGPGR